MKKKFFFQSYQHRSVQNHSSTKQKQNLHENQFFRKQTIYYFDNENRRHFENVIKKKNSKRVRFTTKFRQREFQQKNFLFYEKYRQKLFQQKFFYISKKKTRVFKKNDFKLIFNHELIYDRNRTTNFYVDNSQFISKKKRRFQIMTKKNFFVENMNTT